MQTEEVTKSLAGRDDFVLFLFTLMTNKKTFLQTATLIEDILGVKKVRVILVLNPQHEHLNIVYGPVNPLLEGLWSHFVIYVVTHLAI